MNTTSQYPDANQLTLRSQITNRTSKVVSRFVSALLLVALPLLTIGQIINPVSWQVTAEPGKVPNEAVVVVRATIESNWYLYSSDFDPNLGPILTTIAFKPGSGIKADGALKAINPKKKFDETWQGDIKYFVKTGEFRQVVKLPAGLKTIDGTVEGQACTDKDGRCVPVSSDFSVAVPATQAITQAGEKDQKVSAATETTEPSATSVAPVTDVAPTGDSAVATAGDNQAVAIDTAQASAPATTQAQVSLEPEGTESDGSLWSFFLLSFLAGLAALLTPCVFPMIPMTVSFFTKRQASRAAGIRLAAFYGLSIIGIYTIIGTLVARLNGPEFANFLSTHWAPNLLFFVVFVLFGISFLGAFEIVLPSSLVNRIDKESDKGGLYGVFFMALTIVVVSFSCTGPVVGSVLVASAGGAVLMPVVGMFGFSLAFALPFTAFAIFPQALSSLPKSGGWLNSVKVVLGFLELALSLKFFSVADQAYHWGLLDREVYLALWIVLFGLLGFYLLGKISMPHDSPSTSVSIPRLLMGTAVLAFVVYLIPGMWGAPLKQLAGYLPPLNTQDFVIGASATAASPAPAASTLCEAPRYADKLHWPHGLQGYFDYKQAMNCARQQQKPLFIDFTGHGCVNCREMEARVWSDPRVQQRLRDNFVLVALYVDDKTELPENEWYTSTYDQKQKTSIGKQNADFQVTRFNNNAQPYYVILGADEQPLVQPRAHNLDVEAYVKFLDAAVEAYKAKAKS